MSDGGPSAPPFFRPAAPKKQSEPHQHPDEVASPWPNPEPKLEPAAPKRLTDSAPENAGDVGRGEGSLSSEPLPAPKRKGRPPLHNVTWTDAMRVYKLLSSFPREMQQAIIDAVQEEQ